MHRIVIMLSRGGCFDGNVLEGATLTVHFGQVLQRRREGTSIETPYSDLGFSAVDILLKPPPKENLMLASV